MSMPPAGKADGSPVVAGDARIEYEHRMHGVLEAIDRRLDQPLDLASLAAVTHFSPYHFHRLFAAWMGETLGDYVRRRRVELAAGRLAARSRGCRCCRWRCRSASARATRSRAHSRRASAAPRAHGAPL